MSYNVRKYQNVYPIYGHVDPERSRTALRGGDFTTGQQLRASLSKQYADGVVPADALAPRQSVAQLLSWLGILRISLLRLQLGRLVELLDLAVEPRDTFLALVDCVCVDLSGVPATFDSELVRQYKEALHLYMGAAGFEHQTNEPSLLVYVRVAPQLVH